MGYLWTSAWQLVRNPTIRTLWPGLRGNHHLLVFLWCFSFQSRPSPFYSNVAFNPQAPGDVKHSVEFYCPSFYPDESSFHRHVSPYQMHYVILLSSAETTDMPLGPERADGSMCPLCSDSDLGGFPGIWQKTLSLVPTREKVGLWSCLFSGCHIKK